MRKVDLDRCYDCLLDGSVQVYEITETAYRELCENMYGIDLDLAPDGEYIVVEGLIGYGDVASVRPLPVGYRSLFPAVEDTVGHIDRAKRMNCRNCAIKYEIWHVMPDYLLGAVYAWSKPYPEQPSSDTVSPVVIATDPDTGKLLVMTTDTLCLHVESCLDVAARAISLGYDNVGIVWMRSDWATSQLLATAHLYRLGYGLCNLASDRLGVVTNGRD